VTGFDNIAEKPNARPDATGARRAGGSVLKSRIELTTDTAT